MFKTNARIVFALAALGHAAVMTAYMLGPELAPLVVYCVDFPVVYPLTRLGVPTTPAMIVGIIACSLIYPAILVWALRRIDVLRPPCPQRQREREAG